MLTRREFLRAGLTTGMIFACPALHGCGGSGGLGRLGRREPLIDWFHFDLSETVGTHPGTGGSYYLRAGGQKHRLVEHTAPTLGGLPHSLRGVVGARLPTHYVRSVHLSTDSVSLLSLTHEGDGDVHSWLHLSLYVPDQSSPPTAPAPAPALAAAAGACRHTSTTSDSFHPVIDEGHVYSNPSAVQTAACLVFLHPELVTLDPEATARIADHIWGLEAFYDLYCHIAVSRAASTHGTDTGPWATLVAATEDDGTPILAGDGSPVHHLLYSDETKRLLAEVLKPALQAVKSDGDPRLKDKSYCVGTGVPEVRQAGKAAAGRVAAAASDFKLATKIGNGSWIHGVRWDDLGVADAEERKLKFALTNSNLRNFSLYLQYLDGNGEPIDLEESVSGPASDYLPPGCPGTDIVLSSGLEQIGLSTPSLKFVDLLLAPPTVFGVPLPLIGTTYRPKMPDAAVTARLRVGSLGIPHDSEEYTEYDSVCSWTVGFLSTFVINCAVPSLLLLCATGEDENKSLWDTVKKDPKIWLDVVSAAMSLKGLVTLLSEDERSRSREDFEKSVVSLLAHLATDGAKVALKSPALQKWVASKVAMMTAKEAIPIAGMILQGLALLGTAAELAQTIAESLANPLLYTVDFTLARNVTVTVNRDRRDFKFPSTATHFRVSAGPRRGTPRSVEVQMPATTRSDPMTAVLTDVPTGGTFHIEVSFYDAHDNKVGAGFAAFYRVEQWRIDGLGGSGEEAIPDWLRQKLQGLLGNRYFTTQALFDALYAGLPADRKDAAETYELRLLQAMQECELPNRILTTPGGDVLHDGVHYECTIEACEYPLEARSTYLHKEKIALSGGKRSWVAGDAPTATLADLSTVAGDAALHELTGMTLVQRNGQFGYAWRSSSAGLAQCGSGTTRAELYTVQNLSLGQNPEGSLQTGLYGGDECGLSPPVNLAYDLKGPSSGRGHNFLLVPKDGSFYLRPYVADGHTALTLDGPTAFGRFEHPLAALIYHPAGYVVGVSRTFHKLEILALPDIPQTDANAPRAVVYGGRGELPGLLDRPCGLGMDDTGTIHVLESANRRLQAFDVRGQPVDAYPGTQPFLPLPAGYTFLDLAVTGKGWLYVLGYENYGAAPNDFVLFVYRPGAVAPLFTKRGLAAGKILVDQWRDLYALNYEKIVLPSGRVEPSVSHWIPDTPKS